MPSDILPQAERRNVNYFAVNHPPEEIARYRGKFVAWSMDGRKVLASGDTWENLFAEVRRLGIGPDEHVNSSIGHDW